MRFLLLLLLLAPFHAASAADLVREADFRDMLCVDWRKEVTFSGGMRADCISPNHAIEVDFSAKWKEAIGQAFAYGGASGLRPGIVLICRRADHLCLRDHYGVVQTLEFIDRPATLWECRPSDLSLPTCAKMEFGET